MTTSIDSAAGIGLLNCTHRLGVALDAFLALTAVPLAEYAASRLSSRASQSARNPTALLRWEVENEIERLIALLDAIDGDPDLELTGDDGEPSDNGIADHGGLDEQLFLRPRAIGHRTGSFGDRP